MSNWSAVSRKDLELMVLEWVFSQYQADQLIFCKHENMILAAVTKTLWSASLESQKHVLGHSQMK
jgi:hypothetical protein